MWLASSYVAHLTALTHSGNSHWVATPPRPHPLLPASEKLIAATTNIFFSILGFRKKERAPMSGPPKKKHHHSEYYLCCPSEATKLYEIAIRKPHNYTKRFHINMTRRGNDAPALSLTSQNTSFALQSGFALLEELGGSDAVDTGGFLQLQLFI